MCVYKTVQDALLCQKQNESIHSINDTVQHQIFSWERERESVLSATGKVCVYLERNYSSFPFIVIYLGCFYRDWWQTHT